LYSSSGESPPPPPRALFGREELVKEIVRLVDSLTPIALVGTGGIGKTSIALTILHNVRIKGRFGDNRRFIRCDQFPATRTHFLHRLSNVIGSSVENPEDLAPLRPFLASEEMLIVLDNAESILDPQGTDAQEIYAVVEELSQFNNICLCITSRISTIPPDCETLDVPTLPVEAARNAFYGIYKSVERSDLVDNVLEQLDFHPLSITLLATVAHHNKWDTNRVTKEWEIRRTAMLQTDHNRSLAATIELSLASPMFQELGPDARTLLEVVAFFPQGVSENNLDWLFPTTSGRKNIFDKFCVLSLAYRSNGFTTMLAPLRDYLRPKDPKSSVLLRVTKECYFGRLAVGVDSDDPFQETRWITSEDVNVEHLLDVFTSIDADSTGVWNACANFMCHLFRYKPRLVVLGPKIEGLPDDHPSKPQCLLHLSRVLGSVGVNGEGKRLLIHTLKHWRERGDDRQVAQTLRRIASANRSLNLHKDGILQAKEAVEIYERLNDTVEQANTLQRLALFLAEDDQFDAAAEAASRAIDLLGNPTQSQVCGHYYTLGHIYRSRGETEAAIRHFEVALLITISPNFQGIQPSILLSLVWLYFTEDRFDDAQGYLELLKSYVADDPYLLGQVMVAQGHVWCRHGKFEEAKSEVSRIVDDYEKTGFSANYLEDFKELLQIIEEGMSDTVMPDESGEGGEPLGTVVLPVPDDPLARGLNDGGFPGCTLPHVAHTPKGKSRCTSP